MNPDDGRFNTLPSGHLLGLAALGGFVLFSCGGEPSTESSADPNLATSLESVEGERMSPEFPPVDSTFTIIEDLTADGEADSLELRVVGLSLDDPFSWTVRIWVRSELVFEHEAVDSHWDQFFGEPGFAGNSGNREQDRAAYYLDYLPSNLIHRARRETGHSIFDRDSPAGVYQVVARELLERGVVDEGSVREIIDEVVERLQAGTVVLLMPGSPGNLPLIYIEELGEFVPFVVW